MMTIETLTTLLGWSAIINMGILLFSTIMLLLMRNMSTKLHAKWFDLEEADVSKAYFQYLAQYKIATLVFNVAPYCALKIMAQ